MERRGFFKLLGFSAVATLPAAAVVEAAAAALGLPCPPGLLDELPRPLVIGLGQPGVLEEAYNECVLGVDWAKGQDQSVYTTTKAKLDMDALNQVVLKHIMPGLSPIFSYMNLK